MAIEYSDGKEVEDEILNLVQREPQVDSNRRVGFQAWDQWPARYHLCPERANLVRHFDWRGLDVLELGAGMGAVSRYLAEQARALTVVEGTQSRFAVLRERLRDLGNWNGLVANIQDVQLPKKFDVVCVIGVLEYSELFIDSPNPFLTLLEKAKSFLNPGGVLLLAIENKLGLKYWSGAAEDHTSRLFDGICGYPASKTPKTLSRSELRGLLCRSGLPHITEYFPFPDYKIASSILTQEFIRRFPLQAGDLAAGHAFENYGLPRVNFFPDSLAIRNVTSSGLLPEFSNSFLFVASESEKSETRSGLLRRTLEDGELAWHYSHQRLQPIQTIFSGEDPVTVSKRALIDVPRAKGLQWVGSKESILLSGELFRFQLVRSAYFSDWSTFQSDFKRFFEWCFESWGAGSELRGEALDATIGNALVGESGEFAAFDLEWMSQTPVPKSWFVFRNVFGLLGQREVFSSDSPYRSFRHLYEVLCAEMNVAPDFDADLVRECDLHRAVDSQARPAECEPTFLEAMERPFGLSSFPRNPATEHELRAGFERVTNELAHTQVWSQQLVAEVARIEAMRLQLVTEVARVEAMRLQLERELDTRPHKWARWLRARVQGVRRFRKTGGRALFGKVNHG